jgi:hypothetical protein
MLVGNMDEREPFTTLDGSTIREVAWRVSLPAEHEDTVLDEAPGAAA